MKRELFKRLFKKSLSLLTAAVLIATLFPVIASAETVNTYYIDENGDVQYTMATVVTESTSVLSIGGWYVVNSDVITTDLTTRVDTHLILADGATLTANGTSGHPGIAVESATSSILTIYGQTEGTGTLNATGGDNGAGIGGGAYRNSGTLVINGGVIHAQAGYAAAGIGGGGPDSGSGEIITINGGTVFAKGGINSAGIGSASYGGGPIVTITGGVVVAEGGTLGAGIGTGFGGGDGIITISGGIVVATGGWMDPVGGGAGLGGGSNNSGLGVMTSITGGTVVAAGFNHAAGIGGGASCDPTGSSWIYGDPGTCTISGGTVKIIGTGYSNSPVPTTDGITPALLTQTALENVTESLSVTSLTTSVTGYGTKDLYTDDEGILYLWLPADEMATEAQTTLDRYLGSVTAGTGGTLYESAKVTSVDVPTSGYYGLGRTMSFSVNFNQSVTVDLTNGDPYLPLTIGGNSVHATYQSGSGSSALHFVYTVTSGNNGTLALGDSIEANGGTVEFLGQVVDLDLAGVPATSGILVDTVVPVVSSISPAAIAEDVPASGNLVISFSEPILAPIGVISLTKNGEIPSPIDPLACIWSPDRMTVTIPYAGLAYDSIYTVLISTFSDVAGNVMVPFISQFTTEGEPEAPTVLPLVLIINKGGTAGFGIALGRGASAATAATISVEQSDIASVNREQVTSNDIVTVSGTSVGVTDVTVRFNDVLSTTKIVSIIVQPVIPSWPPGSSLSASDVTQTGATLTWTEAQDDTAVTGYRIYRDGMLIATTEGSITSLSITGLSASTTYAFQVQAGNADGAWSLNGPAVSVTTADATVRRSSTGGATFTKNEPDSAGILLNGLLSGLPVDLNSGTGMASVILDDAVGSRISGGESVEITMPSISGITGYSAELPFGALTSNAGGSLTLHSPVGSLTVPSNILESFEGKGTRASVTINTVDQAALTPTQQDEIGNRPVIELTLTVDGEKVEGYTFDAPVTVSIPYTPTAEELENPENIVIWYVDGSGNLNCVPNGHYDPETGTVTFSVMHFSMYAVGYNTVTFNDVPADAPYRDAVNFVAARRIATGTGNGNFSPESGITRGQFIVMMMNAYGIEADMIEANDTAAGSMPADNFADAGNTYYTNYLSAAKRLGIANGIGDNLYAPENGLTGKEMIQLLYNTLAVLGDMPTTDQGNGLAVYADADRIATRADMAEVLYNLLMK